MSFLFQPRAGLLPIIPFLFFTSTLAQAQEAETALPPVVISATRLPTPEEQVGSSVTVITDVDIERKQERTLPEILQDVPGLNVVQTGGPGETTSVFIRGTNSNHTKVLIDGVDAGDPSSTNGAFDFSQVLAADIERVEVLRGPQSGLYGSDAIGGVVNIITRKGAGPAQFTGSAEAGSFGTFNQTAGISGGMDRFNYAFSAAHYYTDGVQVTPTALMPPGRTATDDKFDDRMLSTRLGANLTDTFDVGLTARYIASFLNSTSDDATGPEPLQARTDNHELFTRATAHWKLFDGVFEQTAGLGYTQYHRSSLDPSVTTFSPFDAFGGDRIKADWQGDVKVMKGQTLTFVAEHQIDQLDDPAQVSAHTVNNAGAVQLQSAFGERLFNTLSLREDDNSRFGSKATYRIAPAFLIPETGTKLKASYGTGFKAPTLDQLFHNYPGFGFSANPNLQPETSVGYDAGFEQSLLGKRVQFGSTYFHNDIKNLITFNDSFTTDINVGKATTRGFENFVSYKPLPALALRADYTFTLAENDITQQELVRRPKNKASLNATWQTTDRISFSSTALYTGPWVDSNRSGTASGITAGGYTLFNLAGEYAFGNGVSAFGRIDNVLDKHYQDPVGFEHPGFGVFAGLKVALDAEKGFTSNTQP